MNNLHLSHENPSCGPRERLRQAVFLENAISATKDKMSLRISALADFIFLGNFGQKGLKLEIIFSYHSGKI